MHQISNFARFCVPALDRLDPYASPESEASLFKAVPMDLLAEAKAILRRVGRLEGQRFRIIYRGPRGHYRHQSSTWRQDARAFSVYVR